MITQEKALYNIVIIGNPNTGKSTLFNRLTGVRQRTGNYPGVTVEKKSGEFSFEGTSFNVTDVPGTYSLAASSSDERIAVDALTGHIPGLARPDCVICVADATNLVRNLFLFSQIADISIPTILVLNMMDAAGDQGLKIDTALLSERLGGIPVIPVVARKGTGIDDLKKSIKGICSHPVIPAQIVWPDCVNIASDVVAKQIAQHSLPALSPSELRRVVFDSGSSILDRAGFPPAEKQKCLDNARASLVHAGYNPLATEALIRYEHLNALTRDAIIHPEEPVAQKSESIDRLLTHRVWGLLIFIGMMYLVFQSIYSWAGPLMDVIDAGTGWVSAQVAPFLDQTPALQSLVTNGIIGGVGSVLIFLPQILILFFFISLLEDTGYMARAAFLMDKLFSWCGLNGRCFVPLLSSYACAIPGILSTRTIEDPKARLTTILIAPLMSCSARLPVYVLLIGAFVEPVYGPTWAALTLFAMHFIGILIALPLAFLLNKFVLKTPPQPFVLE
ncbi:MAG: ferrous iron transport protein B, partial [Verrucomicrobiota bacterium]|nr:ferrous iron transport protein B [Verrucomicrobiota bacterium]